MIAKSPMFSVSRGTLWTFAVAAMARSIVRLRGCPPRSVTAAARRPHSRAISVVNGSGSNVASIAPRRCVRRARSSASEATSTPKCSSAIDATLIAASISPGAVSPINTDVSSSARTAQANGSTSPAGNRSRSDARVRGAGARHIAARAGPATHSRRFVGPSRATSRPATVIVISSPASARRRTSPMLFLSSFCGMVATQHRVAVLLPSLCARAPVAELAVSCPSVLHGSTRLSAWRETGATAAAMIASRA